MCSSKPKTPKTETPDILVTARDGSGQSQSAQARKKSSLRSDMNSPLYQGLTIPRG